MSIVHTMAGSSDPAVILHIGTIPEQNQGGFKPAELLDLRHELTHCPKEQKALLDQLRAPRSKINESHLVPHDSPHFK